MLLNGVASYQSNNGNKVKDRRHSIKKEIANLFALKMYSQGAEESDVTGVFSCHWIKKDLRYPEKNLWVLTPIHAQKTSSFSWMSIEFNPVDLDIEFDYFFLDKRSPTPSKDLDYYIAKRHQLDNRVLFSEKNLETYEKRLYFFSKHKLSQAIAKKRVLIARILLSKANKTNDLDALRAALKDNKDTTMTLSKIIHSLEKKNKDYIDLIGKNSLQWKHPLYDIPLQSCYVLEKRNGKIVLSKVKYETMESFVLENEYFHPKEVKKSSGDIVMFLKLLKPYLSVDKDAGNTFSIEEMDFMELGV